MRALLLSIHTICSFFLLVVVLLQPSKSGGLSGMFGGGGTSFFGGRGAAPFLTKITIVLATIFIVTSVILTSISSITAPTSAIERAMERGEFGTTGWPMPSTGSVIMDTIEE